MEAGIEHFIFVTGRNKSVIEDHFDRQFELEQVLAERGKTAELAILERRPARARAAPASPGSRSRSGSATRCGARASSSATSRSLCCCPTCWCRIPARAVSPRCSTSTRETRRQHHRGRAGARRPGQELRRGQLGEGDGRVFPVDGMVEKPAPGTEPSNLTILGRYILQPEIFGLLSAQEKGAGGEIQLTDAMLALLKRQPFSALKYEGRTFDCGSKVGFLTANVAYALARPDIAAGRTRRTPETSKSRRRRRAAVHAPRLPGACRRGCCGDPQVGHQFAATGVPLRLRGRKPGGARRQKC